MSAYWVEFALHHPVCIVIDYYTDRKAEKEDKNGGDWIDPTLTRQRVNRIAKEATGEEPVAIDVLPYAANPLKGPYRDMTFCYTPHDCKGRTSCPKRRACSE